jgi:excinuclease ABC subunit A
VLVIEHHLDVIKTADYIIDLGPEGGKHGGELIGVGTPEEIIENPRSYTGRYLRPYLTGEPMYYPDHTGVLASDRAPAGTAAGA